MAFAACVFIFILWTTVQVISVVKAFPGLDRVTASITFAFSNFIALVAVVLNGFIPPLPLKPQDYGLFAVVLFVGFTVCNTMGLKAALNRSYNSTLACLVVVGGANLVLSVLLSYALFQAIIGVTAALFSS